MVRGDNYNLMQEGREKIIRELNFKIKKSKLGAKTDRALVRSFKKNSLNILKFRCAAEQSLLKTFNKKRNAFA